MIFVVKELRVEPAIVPFQHRTQFLWTPKGMVDLAEPHDLRDFKPCLLGTWNTTRGERAELDEVEHRPSGLLEDGLRHQDIDQAGIAVSNSSHDLDPVLG